MQVLTMRVGGCVCEAGRRVCVNRAGVARNLRDDTGEQLCQGQEQSRAGVDQRTESRSAVAEAEASGNGERDSTKNQEPKQV